MRGKACMLFMTAAIILMGNSVLLAQNIEFIVTPAGDSIINMNEGTQRTVSVDINETSTDHPPQLRIIDPTDYTTINTYFVRHSGNDTSIVCDLTVAPDFFDSGNRIIRLIGFDAGHDSLTQRIQITVTDFLRQPQITNLPSTVNIDENDSTGFLVSAFDPDDPGGTSLAFTMDSNESWAEMIDSIGPTAVISIGRVPYSVAHWNQTPRIFTFTVRVVDQTGTPNTGTLTVNINNIERPPDFIQPPHDMVLTAYQNTTFNFTFAANDPDNDLVNITDSQNLVHILDTLGWDPASFNGTTLSFRPNTSFEGLLDPSGNGYSFTARDSANYTDVVRINIFVVDTIPEPPRFGDLAHAVVIDEGDSAGILISAFDPDDYDGNGLTFSIAPPPDWASWIDLADQTGPLGTIDIGPVPWEIANWHDPTPRDSILVVVRDETGLAETTYVTLTIHNNNRPPTFVSPPDDILISAMQSFPDTFAFVATDPDTADNPAIYDSLGLVDYLISLGWDANFANGILIFRPSAYAQGLLDTSGAGFIFTARDQSGGMDEVRINIFVMDTIPPSMPTVTSDPSDSLTGSNNFVFSGTKDRDASVWMKILLGQNPGEAFRITDPDDNSTSWSHAELVYYQGEVRFEFYCMDVAGNKSDSTMLEFWLVLGTDNPNIIDPDSVNYHNSLVFNPNVDSFFISFPYPYISQFDLVIRDRQGTTIYSRTDSLSQAPGRFDVAWIGIMNSGPNEGLPAPDGHYVAEFQARIYPVTIFPIPIRVDVILDSYAPYEADFFPESGSTSEQARQINSQTVLALSVGDTGAAGIGTKADMVTPYLEYGQSHRIEFSPIDTIPGKWLADLSTGPAMPAGNYQMTLVISDEASNESRYTKFYQITESREITGFFNYPNPFAPSAEPTNIGYVLGRAVNDLTLEIFDSSGDLVYRKSLDATLLTPQAHEFTWDGRSSWGKTLNNGVYFARLTGGMTTEFLKIAIADR